MGNDIMEFTRDTSPLFQDGAPMRFFGKLFCPMSSLGKFVC
jgi:hypothetical protein